MTNADAKADGALPPADDVARLEWPDHPDRPPVLARVLRDVDGGADHAWVVFECDGLAVSRWMKVESPTVAEDSP